MKTCFENFTLIDGNNTQPLEKAYFIIDDTGIIQEVGTNYDKNRTDCDHLVNMENKYIMPGLIDCHTHVSIVPLADHQRLIELYKETDLVVFAIKHLRELLLGGVTYIRDLGDVKRLTLPLKKYLENGMILGPEMISAGMAITMTGGHGHKGSREADGVDEVTKAVREQIKYGSEVIKVISSGGVCTPGCDVNAYQFNEEELRAAALEAHKAGRKITTHSHALEGTKNSVRAGLDCIEHATILDDEAIDMIVERGVYLVPTFSAVYYILHNGEDAGIPKDVVEKARIISANHMENIYKAFQKGAKIAMGTDAGTPFNMFGVSSAFELELMQRAGFAPKDIIQIATKNGADLLGISEKYGTLEVGKFADFLVMKENPIENICAVQDLTAVYKKGVLVNA